MGGEGGAAGGAAMLDCPLIPYPPTTDDMLIAQNLSDKDIIIRLRNNASRPRNLAAETMVLVCMIINTGPGV